MQMRESRRAVDVARMPGCGGDAPVERLADLSDDDEIVDGARAHRRKKFVPRLEQRARRIAEGLHEIRPGVANTAIADRAIFGDSIYRVGLDERHIHGFNLGACPYRIICLRESQPK